MRRYLSKAPKREYPEGVRIVHNFYPGPLDDPGADRMVGLGGFRVWITDEEPPAAERHCHCGWLGGREHCGTVAVIDANGGVVRGGIPVEPNADGTEWVPRLEPDLGAGALIHVNPA